jgi:hypothetical protein
MASHPLDRRISRFATLRAMFMKDCEQRSSEGFLRPTMSKLQAAKCKQKVLLGTVRHKNTWSYSNVREYRDTGMD